MSLDPIRLRERLAELLARVDDDPRLLGELARARREFFGADQPGYVDPEDGRAMDAAAQRFAEWFVIERPSEVLGETPLEHFGDAVDVDAPCAGSRVGLFLVEAARDELRVRDLDGGERLVLLPLGVRLQPGDVLVGRLFPVDDERSAASTAVSIVTGSPQLAVAFQRDLRNLGLDRRLSQAELEHMVFRNWATTSSTPAVATDDTPIERIEAELQALLDAVGAGERHPATRVSAALREAGEQPGVVIAPLLDLLAFDTAVDLDALRQVLLRLSNAHLRAAVARATPPPAAQPQRPATTGGARDTFRARPGESLGAQLARRIEEGLAAEENVDALFADVERLFGEAIDDGPADDDEGPEDFGDLEPLVREFAWETGASTREEECLAEFVELQRKAPVPRLDIEYLDADDYLRFLLQAWLGAHPRHRAERVRFAFAVIERFHSWLVDSQETDVRERLGFAKRVLVEPLDALQSASVALSAGDDPAVGADRLGLLRVLGCREDRIDLESTDGRGGGFVEATTDATAGLHEGDLLLGAFQRSSDGSGVFLGPVVVVPAAAEHLLG